MSASNISYISCVGTMRVLLKAVCPIRRNNNIIIGISSQNHKVAGLGISYSTLRGFSSKMETNNSYEFKNPYPDFDPQNGNGILDINSKQLDKQLLSKIEHAASQFTEKVNTEGERTKDYSVYTGNAGIALLNFLISQRFNDSKALAKADDLLHRAPQKIKHITFLQDAGPVALNAVVAHYLGKTAESKKSISRLVSVLGEVTASGVDTADECLYGRAGYLYSLLFVRKHLGANSIDSSAIKQVSLGKTEFSTKTKPFATTKNKWLDWSYITDKVVGAILSSGKTRSSQIRSKAPLAYQWHNKNYYGAAHGVAGILYLLLQVVQAMLESGRSHSRATRNRAPLAYEWYGDNYLGAAHGVAGILFMLFKSGVLTEEDKTQLVKPTLDDLLSQRLPSGNFPSSQGSRDGRLVQWCHGAPGFAELLATAYKEFGEERYLKVAEECGDVVWKRGLTTKGYSLCHGVSGNTYTFLQLYQLTGDLKHLYRAGCFADWCLSLPKHEQMKPDRPFSLFEGLGGVAYLLTDIQDHTKAGFPAYSLNL